MTYPENWPRCPHCNDFALDGKATCGRAECQEAEREGQRRRRGAIRPDLPPLPDRMKHLPVDARGYPVPWFVAWVGGAWDFRVIRPGGVETALRQRTCWLCGWGPLGVRKVFVIGPMCAINRITSEPPSHRECAEFAVHACPFMLNPAAKRPSKPLPDGTHAPAGLHAAHNPGVMCLWTTRTYEPFRIDGRSTPGLAGLLIRLGPPETVEWFTRGRSATRAEVDAGIAAGYPALERAARMDGPQGLVELELQRHRLGRYLPSA